MSQNTTLMGTPKVAIVSNRIRKPDNPQKTTAPSSVVSAPTKSNFPNSTISTPSSGGTEVKKSIIRTNTIVKSRKRTSLDEFAHKKHLRSEIKAGFKIWLNGQNFASDPEWEQLYDSYVTRKI